MFVAGSDNIDSCGVDAAVTEYIRKLGNVLFNAVEGARKQMAQIMRKHLLGDNPRLHTQVFHFTPNVASIHRLAAAGYKYSTLCDFLLCCIAS